MSQRILPTLSILLAAALMASASVVFSDFSQSQDTNALTFASFLILTTVFLASHLLSGQRRPAPAERPPTGAGRPPETPGASGRLPLYIGLNLATAGVFVFYHFALKHLEPSIVNAIEASWAPVAGVLFTRLTGGSPVGRRDALRSAALFAAGVALVVGAMLDRTGVSLPRGWLGGLALAACLINAVSYFLVTHFMRKLLDRKEPMPAILAFRSVFILAVTLAVSSSRDIALLLTRDLATVAALALLGIGAPLVLVTRALRSVSPVSATLVFSAVPAFCLAAQLLSDRIRWSGYSAALIAVIFVCSIWDLLVPLARKARAFFPKERPYAAQTRGDHL